MENANKVVIFRHLNIMTEHRHDYISQSELIDVFFSHIFNEFAEFGSFAFSRMLGLFVFAFLGSFILQSFVVECARFVSADNQVSDEHLLAKALQAGGNGAVPDEGLIGVDVDEPRVTRNVLEGIVVLGVTLFEHNKDCLLDTVSAVQHSQRFFHVVLDED